MARYTLHSILRKFCSKSCKLAWNFLLGINKIENSKSTDDILRNAATAEELDEQRNGGIAERGNNQVGNVSTAAASGVSGNKDRRKELMTE